MVSGQSHGEVSTPAVFLWDVLGFSSHELDSCMFKVASGNRLGIFEYLTWQPRSSTGDATDSGGQAIAVFRNSGGVCGHGLVFPKSGAPDAKHPAVFILGCGADGYRVGGAIQKRAAPAYGDRSDFWSIKFD